MWVTNIGDRMSKTSLFYIILKAIIVFSIVYYIMILLGFRYVRTTEWGAKRGLYEGYALRLKGGGQGSRNTQGSWTTQRGSGSSMKEFGIFALIMMLYCIYEEYK